VNAQAEAKVLEIGERIAVALERIAAAVERATLIEPAPTGCLHPPEWRIDFSGMQGADEWECSVKLGGCGFRFPRDVQAESAADDQPTGKE